MRKRLPVGGIGFRFGLHSGGFGHGARLLVDEAFVAEEIGRFEQPAGLPTVKVNTGLSRAAEPHIERALPAMPDMRIVKADDQGAKFGRRQP